MICKHKSIKLNGSKFTYNSIKHQSFVYTQFNDSKVLFQTIQFSISPKLNGSKHFYLSVTSVI